jgi:hypothetical protein
MGSRRLLLVLVVAALAVCVGAPAPAAPPKKKCATVVKKVRGKKRKVKVCPKKVNVSLELDTAHSTSLTVASGTAASEVTTSGSRGKVTLTLPGGATQSGVTIRITPIKSAAHLPVKSFIAGAQVEPDGLQLDKEATLTIQAAKIPKGRLVGFAYSGKGRELHPYPVSRSGNILTFRVGHFSGYGAGIQSDLGRIALVQTMLAEQQSIAADLVAAGPSQLVNSGVLYRYHAWMNAALAYPELIPFRQLLRTAAEQALRAATEQARLSCRTLHQLDPVFDMLRVIAFARSIGIVDVIGPASELDLKACLSFELDFETTITWTVEGGQAVSRVQAKQVPLDWTNNWSAQQTLEYLSFSLHPQPAGCSMSLDPHGTEPFKASIPLMRQFQLPLSESARIVTDVDVGRGAETITITCPDGGRTATGYYYNGIYVFHNFMPTFTIANWSLAGGAVFATRDYNQTFNGGEGTITEATHFVLRHTPR